MVVALVRYFSNQGTSRSVIIAFAGGVILLYLFASMLWERAAKNRIETEISRPVPAAPSFPIPKLPMDISTISVPKAGQERVIHE
jgi:NADH:ubiquinone oxidoreductase subunit 6 (subunit J)